MMAGDPRWHWRSDLPGIRDPLQRDYSCEVPPEAGQDGVSIQMQYLGHGDGTFRISVRVLRKETRPMVVDNNVEYPSGDYSGTIDIVSAGFNRIPTPLEVLDLVMEQVL